MTAGSTLYCFPHAAAIGFGVADWQARMGDAVDLVGLHYPGHGALFFEPLADSIEAIARRLLRDLPQFEPGATAFFGHSMGALVAYETCRQLQSLGRPLPGRLVVSGCGAPHMPRNVVLPHALPDEELADYLSSLGGVSDAVLEDREMRGLLLPIARADFAACRRYAPTMRQPLAVELHVYSGDADEFEPGGLAAWSDCTSAGTRFRTFPGGHFYFDACQAMFLDALSADTVGPCPVASGR